MKGDFSRRTLTLNATRVLMQQGRVQLDADWNEQVEIGAWRLRRFIADAVGRHGGPKDHLGYALAPVDGAEGDLGIGAGRYYVGGWGCENQRDDLRYTTQDDLPGLKPLGSNESLWSVHYAVWGGAPPEGAPAEGENSLLVFLDVWERHVCAGEDERLLDVGLGGLDTATRAVLMAQVRVLPAPAFPAPTRGQPKADPDAAPLAYLGTLFPEGHRPRLKARAKGTNDDADPCLSDPDARYRGPENQLYRVEVHRGGPADKATFKWSRDNGSLVFPVTELSSSRATLQNLGRDERSTLDAGQWVELLDEARAKHGTPGLMLHVTKVDRDAATVDFDAGGQPVPAFATLVRPFLRRWDHPSRLGPDAGTKLEEGALKVVEATGQTGWLRLEDGVEVQFQKPSPNDEPYRYRSGDYWLIPARTATGDVEWPGEPDAPLGQPPDGVRHRYAPLALVEIDDGEVGVKKDLRRQFEALAKPVA
jgi:hypothetical protein